MGSSQQNWQEMEQGTCPVCSKVRRVCREDGCNGEPHYPESFSVYTKHKPMLLDEYPAYQSFSTVRIGNTQNNCPDCGMFFHGYTVCPFCSGKINKGVEAQVHHSGDEDVEAVERKLNKAYGVYEEPIEPLEAHRFKSPALKTLGYKLNELVAVVNKLKEVE